jgi:DHA1 family multidrug resistance protein-like MFS transporter
MYTIIYSLLVAFPICYKRVYKMNAGQAQLPFLSVLIGILMGAIVSPLYNEQYARLRRKHGRFIPEERLKGVREGVVVLVIGMFWWGWTVRPSSKNFDWNPFELTV